MKKNEALIFGFFGAAIALLILAWWLKDQEIKDKNRLNDDKDKRIGELEINNLQLIQELLKQEGTLPDIVKKQLLDLVSNYELKDAKVAKELISIVNLVEIEEYEKAVMSITKIIEHILKRVFKNDNGFKAHLVNPDGKKRRADLSEYLLYAKNTNLISKAEYQFALAIKEYRNEEAHEIINKRQLNLNMSSILSAIELIVKCDNYQAVLN